MKLGIVLLVGVSVLGSCGAVWAQDDTDAVTCSNGLPQWEVGLFGVGARLPLYRGSDEHKDYVFALPYLIYRGEVVQVEREGVRGLFYRGQYVETDVSMGGNPPVTDGAAARQGMPELDPLVEVGPALRLILCRGKTSSLLHIEAAGRGAISVDRSDLGTAYEGKRVILSLVAPRFKLGQGSPWSAGCRAGVDFADGDYHGYFYDVEADQVRPDRDVYHSGSGYSGCYLAWYVTRKLMPGLSASIYMQWDNMDGAVYEDSPLLKTHNSYVVGAAMVWKLAESEKRAEIR